MSNPIVTLLDLASKIEDYPEDVSGRDAVKTIRAATEALEARLTEAERLLRPIAECDPDIREWLGMPRWPIAATPADSADCVHDLASDGFGRHRCSICGLTTTVAEVQK